MYVRAPTNEQVRSEPRNFGLKVKGGVFHNKEVTLIGPAQEVRERDKGW